MQAQQAELLEVCRGMHAVVFATFVIVNCRSTEYNPAVQRSS
jgi:hypothetical protein